MQKNAKYSLTILAALMLAACGGSGSSSNGTDNSSSSATTDAGSNSQSIANASQFNLEVAVQSATSGVLYVDNSNAKTIVCIDEDNDDTCNGDSIKSYADSKGNALLSWNSDFSGKNVLAVSSDTGLVQKYSLNNISYTKEGDNVTYNKLYLNPISSAQNVIEAEGNSMNEWVGSQSSMNFAETDPASDKNYQTLIETYNNGVYSSNSSIASSVESQVDKVLLRGLYKAIDKAYKKGFSKSVIVTSIASMYENNVEVAVSTFSTAIESSNKAPVASFDYLASIDGTVKYTNSSVDKDGDKLTYHWYLAYGALSSEKNVTYKYGTSGLYPVVLIVSDGTLYDAYRVKVPVSIDNYPISDDPIVNHAPVAKFSTSINGLAVSVTNESTDQDNDTLTYTWNMGDGKSFSKSSEQFTYTYEKAGTYTITLSANDGSAINESSKSVTVASDEKPCVGDDCPCEGDNCPPPPCEGDSCPCEGDNCPPVCEGDDCIDLKCTLTE